MTALSIIQQCLLVPCTVDQFWPHLAIGHGMKIRQALLKSAKGIVSIYHHSTESKTLITFFDAQGGPSKYCR